MSQVNKCYDVKTNNSLQSNAGTGLYAKIFRILNSPAIETTRYFKTASHFRIRLVNTDGIQEKEFTLQCYVITANNDYRCQLVDLDGKVNDIKLVAVNDGTYTTFYVRAQQYYNYNNGFEVQFLQMSEPNVYELFQGAEFVEDLSSETLINPSYDATISQQETTNITFANSWNKISDTNYPCIAICDIGQVEKMVKLQCVISGGTLTPGTKVLTLPYLSKKQMDFQCWDRVNNQFRTFRVYPNSYALNLTPVAGTAGAEFVIDITYIAQ